MYMSSILFHLCIRDTMFLHLSQLEQGCSELRRVVISLLSEFQSSLLNKQSKVLASMGVCFSFLQYFHAICILTSSIEGCSFSVSFPDSLHILPSFSASRTAAFQQLGRESPSIGLSSRFSVCSCLPAAWWLHTETECELREGENSQPAEPLPKGKGFVTKGVNEHFSAGSHKGVF